MRKVINLIIVAYIAVLTMSCSNSSVDNSLPAKDRLQGTWEVVKAEGEMADLNVGANYIFEGTKMTTEKGFEVSGELIATDSTIIWKLENMEMNYTYKFDGNTLVIEPLNSGQKLYLEKK